MEAKMNVMDQTAIEPPIGVGVYSANSASKLDTIMGVLDQIESTIGGVVPTDPSCIEADRSFQDMGLIDLSVRTDSRLGEIQDRLTAIRERLAF